MGQYTIRFLLVYLGLTGDVDEPATILLSTEYAKKYGRLLKDGWIVMDYWASYSASQYRWSFITLIESIGKRKRILIQ